MKKTKLNWKGLLFSGIALIMLYFGLTTPIGCYGWNIINPFCWLRTIITHGILIAGSVAFGLAAIITFIWGGRK